MWELAKLGILPPPGDPKAMKMAGSSAGSLAIATYACGLDVDKATNALFELAANCRENGTRGRLGTRVITRSPAGHRAGTLSCPLCVTACCASLPVQALF